MKINKVLSIIVILTIPYLILIGNFYFYFYNENFYYKQFKENNVNVKDKELVLYNLLNFFKGEEELKYFNENEKAHLVDVKNLINKFISIFYILLILDIFLLVILCQKSSSKISEHAQKPFLWFLTFIKLKNNFKNYIKKILFYSGLLTISIILIFLILSLNFNFLFTNFHRLFFAGNWIFSEKSLLIQLFPFNFFRNFFIKILIDSFITSLILILISFLIKENK